MKPTGREKRPTLASPIRPTLTLPSLNPPRCIHLTEREKERKREKERERERERDRSLSATKTVFFFDRLEFSAETSRVLVPKRTATLQLHLRYRARRETMCPCTTRGSIDKPNQEKKKTITVWKEDNLRHA